VVRLGDFGEGEPNDALTWALFDALDGENGRTDEAEELDGHRRPADSNPSGGEVPE